MTNDELDRARVDEATRLWGGSKNSLPIIVARLAREGWTPPVKIDPDLAEANRLYETMDWPDGLKGDTRECYVAFIHEGIKRGRELERKAKSRLIMTTIGKGVTVEHYADGTSKAVQPEDIK